MGLVEVVVLVAVHQAPDLVVQPGEALLDAPSLLSVRSTIAERQRQVIEGLTVGSLER